MERREEAGRSTARCWPPVRRLLQPLRWKMYVAATNDTAGLKHKQKRNQRLGDDFDVGMRKDSRVTFRLLSWDT